MNLNLAHMEVASKYEWCMGGAGQAKNPSFTASNFSEIIYYANPVFFQVLRRKERRLKEICGRKWYGIYIVILKITTNVKWSFTHFISDWDTAVCPPGSGVARAASTVPKANPASSTCHWLLVTQLRLKKTSSLWLILSYFRILPNHASWILRFLRGTPSTYPG